MARTVYSRRYIGILYHQRGIPFFNLGNYRRALVDCGATIKINPRATGAYYGRRQTYKNLGEYSQAINDFTEVVRPDLQHVRAYSARGGIYLTEVANGQHEYYELAVRDLTNAIKFGNSELH